MQTVEQLMERIKQLENQEGLLVVKGEIMFIHLPEHPTEKLSKIEIGLDTTEIINGRPVRGYVGMQVSNYEKELFAQFDQTEGNARKAFSVGDKVKAMCTVGAFQPYTNNKKGGRQDLINNTSLIRCKVVQKANAVAPEVKNEEAFFAQSAANAAATTEDTPF